MMTMKNLIGRKAAVLFTAFAVGLGASACTDLTVEPRSQVTAGNIFQDTDSYRAFLAKVYAGLAVTGQQGPAGQPDIEGIDEGFSQYVRVYWQLQQLPTDEAVIGWGDAGLPEVVGSQWSSTNQFVSATYYRVFFQVALANEFLRETAPDVLASRGHDGLPEMPQYRAEARLLRALSYWHALDLFGSVPLVLEDYAAGDPPPAQATRDELFAFVEQELLDVRSQLPGVGQAEYGRFDQGGLAMILAKLYLNSEAYGLGDRYADAMAELETVISGPYQLDPNYRGMFLADNQDSPEFIFAIPFDGQFTQTFGGVTFLAHAAVGGNMNPADYGLDFGWWGLRSTPEFVNNFEGGADGPDQRASEIFFTDGQVLEIDELGDFFDGFTYPKYSNITSDGAVGSNVTFPDIDFPMFRLADAYLMYAESCLRSGGGACEATSLGYVNDIRERAYGDESGNIAATDLDLDFILAERSRELGWEGHRRQDLIRYGLFTGGDYVWTFKGGAPDGVAIDDFRQLYPLPAGELLSNPNLEQNPGY